LSCSLLSVGRAAVGGPAFLARASNAAAPDRHRGEKTAGKFPPILVTARPA